MMEGEERRGVTRGRGGGGISWCVGLITSRGSRSTKELTVSNLCLLEIIRVIETSCFIFIQNVQYGTNRSYGPSNSWLLVTFCLTPMKKGVNTNIILKIQFLPHNKHAVPPLQRATNSSFFHWRYRPLWALACRTMSLCFVLSVTNSVHLLTPNI